jgi:hypothetical protein
MSNQSLPEIRTVSLCDQKELRVAQLLVELAGAFGKLDKKSRRAVMRRWEVLNMMTATERDNFYRWIERIT